MQQSSLSLNDASKVRVTTWNPVLAKKPPVLTSEFTPSQMIAKLRHEMESIKSKQNELNQIEFKLDQDLSSYNNRYKMGFFNEWMWRDGMGHFHRKLIQIQTKRKELAHLQTENEAAMNRYLSNTQSITPPQILTPPPTPKSPLECKPNLEEKRAKKAKVTNTAFIDLTGDSDDGGSVDKLNEKAMDEIINQYCENIGKDYVFVPTELPDLMEDLGNVQYPSPAFDKIIAKEKVSKTQRSGQGIRQSSLKTEPAEEDNRKESSNHNNSTKSVSNFKQHSAVNDGRVVEIIEDPQQTLNSCIGENIHDDSDFDNFSASNKSEIPHNEYYCPPSSPSAPSSASISTLDNQRTGNQRSFKEKISRTFSKTSTVTSSSSSSSTVSETAKSTAKRTQPMPHYQKLCLANDMIDKRKRKCKAKKVQPPNRSRPYQQLKAVGSKSLLNFACYEKRNTTTTTTTTMNRTESRRLIPEPTTVRPPATPSKRPRNKDFERNFFEVFEKEFND